MAHIANPKDVVKAYVVAETERLKAHGNFTEADTVKLEKEVQALFANIWSEGSMSNYALSMAAEELIENGVASWTLEEAFENSRHAINPWK